MKVKAVLLLGIPLVVFVKELGEHSGALKLRFLQHFLFQYQFVLPLVNCIEIFNVV